MQLAGPAQACRVVALAIVVFKLPGPGVTSGSRSAFHPRPRSLGIRLGGSTNCDNSQAMDDRAGVTDSSRIITIKLGHQDITEDPSKLGQ